MQNVMAPVGRSQLPAARTTRCTRARDLADRYRAMCYEKQTGYALFVARRRRRRRLRALRRRRARVPRAVRRGARDERRGALPQAGLRRRATARRLTLAACALGARRAAARALRGRRGARADQLRPRRRRRRARCARRAAAALRAGCRAHDRARSGPIPNEAPRRRCVVARGARPRCAVAVRATARTARGARVAALRRRGGDRVPLLRAPLRRARALARRRAPRCATSPAQRARNGYVRAACHQLTHRIGRAAGAIGGHRRVRRRRSAVLVGLLPRRHRGGDGRRSAPRSVIARARERLRARCASATATRPTTTTAPTAWATASWASFASDVFASLRGCDALADALGAPQLLRRRVHGEPVGDRQPRPPAHGAAAATSRCIPARRSPRRYREPCFDKQTSYALYVTDSDYAQVFRLCSRVERGVPRRVLPRPRRRRRGRERQAPVRRRAPDRRRAGACACSAPTAGRAATA